MVASLLQIPATSESLEKKVTAMEVLGEYISLYRSD
jgi:hypothetical protein